jgi:hypothetical protein
MSNGHGSKTTFEGEQHKRPPFDEQSMSECHQHRSIGIGTDRDPFRSHQLRSIVADGTYVDDLNTGASEFCEPTAARMRAAPALHHLHILRVRPAEKHHQTCVVCNRGPRRQRTSHGLRVAEYMRQEGERRAEAVIRCLIEPVLRGRESADLTRSNSQRVSSSPRSGTLSRVRVVEEV